MIKKTKDDLKKEQREQKRKKFIEKTNFKIDAIFAKAWKKLDTYKKRGKKRIKRKNLLLQLFKK